MKYLLLTLTFLTLIPAAMATSVTYSTSGTLCPTALPCAGDTLTFVQGGGVLTLSFAGAGSSSVDPGGPGGFTFGSLGTLTAACSATCTAEDLTGAVLTISVAQSAPTVGGGDFAGGTISGSLSGSGSTAFISWPATTVVAGLFTYSITNNPLAIVAPPTGVPPGVTSIQGRIDEASPVPEPATYLLLSAGLLGLGLRRRFLGKKA